MDPSADTSGARDGRRRTAVMADVAKLAGVSHQTVSRVINDSAHVRPETRRGVLAAMRELDYRPNPAARALVTGRSRTLGVVTFDTTLFGPASTLLGIERAAHAEGYHITLVTPRSPTARATLDAAEHLCKQGVDGVLVIAPRPETARALGSLLGRVALVVVGADAAHDVPCVAVDNVRGGELATAHLLAAGARRIAFLVFCLSVLVLALAEIWRPRDARACAREVTPA